MKITPNCLFVLSSVSYQVEQSKSIYLVLFDQVVTDLIEILTVY